MQHRAHESVLPLSLETNKAPRHHSNDTQMETRLLNSDHQCENNETNTQSLRSETCGAVKAKAEAAELRLQDAGASANEGAGAVRVKNALSESSDALPRSSAEENGRERLKRHRIDVAGRVWIPDIWGQEEMLKDWIDCSAFDASLVPTAIMSARAALVQERTRANSGGLRIENRFGVIGLIFSITLQKTNLRLEQRWLLALSLYHVQNAEDAAHQERVIFIFIYIQNVGVENAAEYFCGQILLVTTIGVIIFTALNACTTIPFSSHHYSIVIFSGHD